MHEELPSHFLPRFPPLLSLTRELRLAYWQLALFRQAYLPSSCHSLPFRKVKVLNTSPLRAVSSDAERSAISTQHSLSYGTHVPVQLGVKLWITPPTADPIELRAGEVPAS